MEFHQLVENLTKNDKKADIKNTWENVKISRVENGFLEYFYRKLGEVPTLNHEINFVCEIVNFILNYFITYPIFRFLFHFDKGFIYA